MTVVGWRARRWPAPTAVGVREVRASARPGESATGPRPHRREPVQRRRVATSRPATRSASSTWAACRRDDAARHSRRAPSGGGRSRSPRSRCSPSSGSSSIAPRDGRLAARVRTPAAAARRAGAMTLPSDFTDPIWLWLAVPVGAIVVVGWLAASRTLPRGRRIASLVIRLVLAACLVAVAGGDAPRAAVGSAERGLPARRIGLDARRDPTRSSSTGPGRPIGEMPEGDTAGRRGLRRQRAGRSPAVGARRAARARLGPGGRRDRRRGRGAAGGRDLPSRHAAADRAPLRRQRHRRRGRGCDRRRGRARHSARRRHAGRRVGRRGAGRRARCAAGRAGRRDDRPGRPAALHDHDRRHPAPAGRRRNGGHSPARPRAGQRHGDPVHASPRTSPASTSFARSSSRRRSVQREQRRRRLRARHGRRRRSWSPPTMPSVPPTSSPP